MYEQQPSAVAASLAASTAHEPAFPALPAHGTPVDAKAFASSGTLLHLLLAGGVTGFVLLLFVVGTTGVGLIALLIAPLVDYFLRKRILAELHGSALHVTTHQLPELHRCVTEYSQRLGLQHVPEVYLIEGNVLNAAAAKIGGRKVVMLLDDTVWGCVDHHQPDALKFIVAHELAHHALGHTGAIRRYLAQVWRPLAREDELSADRVALALVGDRVAARQGLALLLVGPQMLRHVNMTALMKQASEVAANKDTKRAERRLTHPLVLRRLEELMRA